jgi:DNA-binding response OmpR family regulator
MLIYIASPRPDSWQDFKDGLAREPQAVVEAAETGAMVLEMVKSRTPALVVVDSQLPDFKPFDLVLEILKVNAMVQTAVVSSLSDEDFHEQSEGLGIMARIPLNPSAEGAVELVGLLKGLI